MKSFRAKTRTKIIIVLILFLASVTVSVIAQQQSNHFIMFNDQRMYVSNVINRNGRLYYPSRELVDRLVNQEGRNLVDFVWNGPEQPFFFIYFGQTVEMSVGSPMVALGNGAHFSQMSAVPFIHTDGRLYVPIRYVYEPLGFIVTFNESLRVPDVRTPHSSIYLRP